MNTQCEYICKKTGEQCNRHFRSWRTWYNNEKQYCFQHEKISLIEEEKKYNERKEQLTKALEEKGLKLRDDSKLCMNYINDSLKERWTIDGIVERMCQMKYLFEYCNIESYMEKAEKEYYDELNAGYLPDCSIIDTAEAYAMKNKEYPNKWPWLEKS